MNTLERELRELERTDPAIGAAARKYDAMRDELLAKPLPLPARDVDRAWKAAL